MDIAQDVLKTFLSYDAQTGVFVRIRAANHRHVGAVGKPCGSVNRATGYVEIQVGGAKHYAHRLAWIYERGEIPAGCRIDHENRIRSDNRFANLRTATQADNLRNCKVRRDNTSGIKGVSFDASRGKWSATVGKVKLGRFDSLEAAAAARAAAAREAFGAFATD